MTSTRSHRRGTPRQGWRWLVIAVTMVLLASTLGPLPVAAQEDGEDQETPDIVIPGTGDDEPEPEGSPDAEAQPEPTADAAEDADEEPASREAPGIPATEPGNPAVIAQGLAFLAGERVVWQVREIEPDEPADAAPETSNAAVVYQVEGTSVVRNEVTGKRALIEPGEAFFKSGGDAYTTFANSPGSRIWVFEVVDDRTVAADAFYESPLIEDYDEGVFDMEMIRYVLQPGESADLPAHSGPALVMSTMGDIDIESGGLGLLGTGDGQLVTEDGFVINNSQDPVVYVVVALGTQVTDTSAASPSGQTPDATSEETEPGEADDADAAGDTTETVEDPDPVDESGEQAGQSSDGSQGSSEYRASINITALTDLYVVVVVDGTTVFDGPIPEGGQSGVIVGSVFEVYTTYGAGTMFTDACGNDFFMGYEEGEVRYTLQADANSCPP